MLPLKTPRLRSDRRSATKIRVENYRHVCANIDLHHLITENGRDGKIAVKRGHTNTSLGHTKCRFGHTKRDLVIQKKGCLAAPFPIRFA